MLNWIAKLYDVRRDSRGVTAIEYAFIATLIAVAVIGGATTLGVDLNDAYAGFAGHL
ncbi:Flp family type IVb pilin [uncultured Rhodospira sp.]|uniref:Flp family type IVb pilin n=1 Tax=uncultured Rhodospira sp. TaxID=1936189 RepID=UPI002624621C|nr:Flp family type IVb pilin [uncultured Rhodospira sp.]